MFPAQTSLIPVQVALARFFEQGGLLASVGVYPYWYLGTTPFRYLAGPILPSALALIHRLLPNFSLFEIMFGVIGVCWVIGGVGVYLLVQALIGADKQRQLSVLATLFYLLGPIVPFLFRFSDGLSLVAFSFLPFVLLMYLRLLGNWSRKQTVFMVLMISFILLIDSLILPTLVLGMAAIFLAQVGWKKVEERLKRSLLLIACCLALVTFWYSPGYWWTILGSPSFGGKGLVEVVIWLSKLLPMALAMTLAIISARFFKIRNLLRDFTFYWLFIFGFLTLIRFLSDPDFWLDWSAYGTELQLGTGITMGMIAHKIYGLKYRILLLAFYFLLFAFVFNKYVLGTLQRDIIQTVEYQISKQLSQITKPGEKVFLSGTTTFWLNAFFDIPQVRGGVDQASVHSDWREAAWEIREGPSTNSGQVATGQWLRALKITYLVVHTEESEEYYHDFVYPEKFENIPGLIKVYEGKGDRIYKVATPL